MINILAVDDDHDILFTLQAICKVATFNISISDDGHQALQLLQESNFNLIMVDYHMPKMNGLKLVKKIREMDNQIPILVLTVDESLDLANKFIDAGATDFAIKPIRAADLISRIKLHLKLNQLKNTDEIQINIDEESLPKGMTIATLKIILEYLQKNKSPETINKISEKTGLAYQTVHRYLDYLLKANYIDVIKNYGKIGRPINQYFYNKGKIKER